MANVYGGQGVSPTLRGLPTNVFELEAGNTMLVPAGTWALGLSGYTRYQTYDPISTIWRDVGNGDGQFYVQSDGINHRVANQTGCAVGALLLTAGSGYTSAPTVTPSAGSSVWQAIVGGAVNTSITVSNGGTNYIYPPIVQFSVPPSPGIQATGYATISGGAVTSITVTDQGAGYTSAPVIYLVNDPRDTTGAGATATCVLTGSQTITGLLCLDFGNPLTAVPTLTFSGGGGSAPSTLVLMAFTITGVVINAPGSGYTSSAGYVEVRPLFGSYTSATSYTNVQTQYGLVRARPAQILLPTSAAGVISSASTQTSSTVLQDGGIYANAPQGYAILGNGVVATAASLTFTVGGTNGAFRMLAV